MMQPRFGHRVSMVNTIETIIALPFECFCLQYIKKPFLDGFIPEPELT
jgi:hypothetical protein